MDVAPTAACRCPRSWPRCALIASVARRQRSAPMAASSTFHDTAQLPHVVRSGVPALDGEDDRLCADALEARGSTGDQFDRLVRTLLDLRGPRPDQTERPALELERVLAHEMPRRRSSETGADDSERLPDSDGRVRRRKFDAGCRPIARWVIYDPEPSALRGARNRTADDVVPQPQKGSNTMRPSLVLAWSTRYSSDFGLSARRIRVARRPSRLSDGYPGHTSCRVIPASSSAYCFSLGDDDEK